MAEGTEVRLKKISYVALKGWIRFSRLVSEPDGKCRLQHGFRDASVVDSCGDSGATAEVLATRGQIQQENRPQRDDFGNTTTVVVYSRPRSAGAAGRRLHQLLGPLLGPPAKLAKFAKLPEKFNLIPPVRTG